MKKFTFKNLTTDLEKEFINIGYDKSYILNGIKKFEYKNFKIFDLTPAQANILKQTALSVGADCATHRETITGKTENTDCILGGSISQLKKIAEKLKNQPFNLKILGENLIDELSFNLKPLTIKETTFDFTRPYIVGVLNLGNSFSDGYTNFNEAKNQFVKLVNDGADIIELGAESTRPNSKPVDEDEQISKILPVLEFTNDYKIPVSIDTRSEKVSEICLKNGADIINDVSGFDYDKNLSDVVAKYNCPVVIQHSSSTPDVMQQHTSYKNLLDDIFISLNKKIEFAKAKGIENIIIDPGIGFGKTREQCVELLKRFKEFETLNVPIMFGISRKSFLNMSEKDNFTKDIFTLAINSILMNKGVNFVRVHNVELHRQLLNLKVLEE